MKSFLAVAALLAVAAESAAQVPAFIGQLLIQPALTSTMCLTAADNADGAKVVIRKCAGTANQKWVFQNGGVVVHNNKCLDVVEGVNQDGTKLQVWSCGTNPNANQRFNFDLWSKRLTWAGKNKCVELYNGNVTTGVRPQIRTCATNKVQQTWDVGYMSDQTPAQSQNGQYGTNQCGTTNSQTSKCQTAWINSAQDFCLFGPPVLGTVGENEHRAVSFCTKEGRGTRNIPVGTLSGVHYVKTPEYVQITGAGNFTFINVPRGDDGGELDNRGATGTGNPVGGLLYTNSFGTPGLQIHEWTEFLSDREFCIRGCIGARAPQLCNHIYDRMGCWWNIPGNYNPGQFENCESPAGLPMGVYGTSTYKQGASPTPSAHPAPSSTNCVNVPSVTVAPARRGLDRHRRMAKRAAAPAFPGATPPA